MIECQACLRRHIAAIASIHTPRKYARLHNLPWLPLLSSPAYPSLAGHTKRTLTTSFELNGSGSVKTLHHLEQLRHEQDSEDRLPAREHSVRNELARRRQIKRDEATTLAEPGPRHGVPTDSDRPLRPDSHIPSTHRERQSQATVTDNDERRAQKRPLKPQGEELVHLSLKLLFKELLYLKDPLKLADHVRNTLKHGDEEKATSLVRLSSRSVKNVVSWNHLIDWQMGNGKTKVAIETYNEVFSSLTMELMLRGDQYAY